MSKATLTWDAVIKNAFLMYQNRHMYAYWYDIKGKVLTDEAMDYIIKIHPEHYKRWSKAEIEALKAYSRGKIGYDCTGFIWAITNGTVGGSADSIYKNAPVKYKDSYETVAGSMLHKPGHAGIDIGYGWGFHMPIEGHTVELVHSREYDWTDGCQLVGIDYEGADAR